MATLLSKNINEWLDFIQTPEIKNDSEIFKRASSVFESMSSLECVLRKINKPTAKEKRQIKQILSSLDEQCQPIK